MNITNRLAWREITAHAGRSWLIAVLIALPVLVASGTSVWFATQGGTPEASVARAMGRTEVRVDVGPAPTSEQRAAMAAAVAEHGGVTEAIGVAEGELRGATVEFGLVAVDAIHYQLEGRWLVHGDTGGDHVLLTRGLMAELDLGVGDPITLDGAQYPVGGSIAVGDMQWPGVEGVVVTPEHPLAPAEVTSLFLPQSPGVEALAEFGRVGLQVTQRDWLRETSQMPGDERTQTLMGLLATGLGALVVASVAASAFTISIRQMRRALALLSATGASPSVLTRVLVRNGLFLGVGGALLGVASGVVLGAGAAWLQQLLDPQPGFAVVLRWGAIAMFAGIGVLAALVAVWLPSRGVARQDALAALSDAEAAMPEPRVPWPALVPLLLGSGLLVVSVWRAREGVPLHDGTELKWVLVGSAGVMVLTFMAAVLAAPWVVERLARWVPKRWTAWRLALREAARVGRRSVALVAASASIVALGAWASTYVAAMGNHELATYRVQRPVGVVQIMLDQSRGAPSFDEGASRVAVVQDVLGPADAVLEASGPENMFAEEDYTQWWVLPQVDDWGVTVGVVVGGAEEVAFALGAEPAPEVVEALASGKAVVFEESYFDDGLIEFSRSGMDGGQEFHELVPVDAVLAGPVPGMDVVLPTATAAELGMDSTPVSVWLRYEAILTPAQEDAAHSAVRTLGGNYWVSYERGPHSGGLALLPWILLVVGVLAAAIAVVGMVLSLGDGRATRVSLATIGATTGMLRRLATAQAVVCVLLGGLVGVAAGALPTAILFATSTFGMGGLPWLVLAALVFGPMLVVAVAAALLVRPVQGQAVRAD